MARDEDDEVSADDAGAAVEHGSGEGGNVGTAASDMAERPAGGQEDSSVVSGGGLVDESEAD